MPVGTGKGRPPAALRERERLLRITETASGTPRTHHPAAATPGVCLGVAPRLRAGATLSSATFSPKHREPGAPSSPTVGRDSVPVHGEQAAPDAEARRDIPAAHRRAYAARRDHPRPLHRVRQHARRRKAARPAVHRDRARPGAPSDRERQGSTPTATGGLRYFRPRDRVRAF